MYDAVFVLCCLARRVAVQMHMQLVRVLSRRSATRKTVTAQPPPHDTHHHQQHAAICHFDATLPRSAAHPCTLHHESCVSCLHVPYRLTIFQRHLPRSAQLTHAPGTCAHAWYMCSLSMCRGTCSRPCNCSVVFVSLLSLSSPLSSHLPLSSCLRLDLCPSPLRRWPCTSQNTQNNNSSSQ